MDGIAIQFERRLFSDNVIVRAAHRYSAFFSAEFGSDADYISVKLTPLAKVDLPRDLEERFRNDVLDERLREIIRAQTSELHLELVRAALREATPRKPAALA